MDTLKKHIADIKYIISESRCRDFSDDHGERLENLRFVVREAERDKNATLAALIALLTQTDEELGAEPSIERSDVVRAFNFIIPSVDISPIIPQLVKLYHNERCVGAVQDILLYFAFINKQNARLILSEIEKAGIDKNKIGVVPVIAQCKNILEREG